MDVRPRDIDPHCSHPESRQRQLFAARDYISGQWFDIRICDACGLTITWPRPDDPERFYPSGYYGEGRRYPVMLQLFLDSLHARRARRLEAIAGGRPGRALDVGCGQGSLLDRLRRCGWQVVGTELNDRGARYAREVLDLDVRTGDVVKMRLPTENFDTVILWHVLEHVADPFTLLGEAARLLRPGGVLLLAVPNFGSPEARIGKAAWFHLDVPRHLNHFTRPALRRALDDVGFDVGASSYFSPEYDLFSAVQTALNRLGLHQNLLYNLLRRGGARPLSSQLSAPSTRDYALTLALTPLLGALGLIWVPLAAALGLGATMTIHARKRE